MANMVRYSTFRESSLAKLKRINANAIALKIIHDINKPRPFDEVRSELLDWLSEPGLHRAVVESAMVYGWPEDIINCIRKQGATTRYAIHFAFSQLHDDAQDVWGDNDYAVPREGNIEHPSNESILAIFPDIVVSPSTSACWQRALAWHHSETLYAKFLERTLAGTSFGHYSEVPALVDEYLFGQRKLIIAMAETIGPPAGITISVESQAGSLPSEVAAVDATEVIVEVAHEEPPADIHPDEAAAVSHLQWVQQVELLNGQQPFSAPEVGGTNTASSGSGEPSSVTPVQSAPAAAPTNCLLPDTQVLTVHGLIAVAQITPGMVLVPGHAEHGATVRIVRQMPERQHDVVVLYHSTSIAARSSHEQLPGTKLLALTASHVVAVRRPQGCKSSCQC